MTNKDRLSRLGRALYGERWMRAVSFDLGVDPKQVRRWASGAYEPPDERVSMLRRICEQRIDSMSEVLDDCFAQSE